MSSAHYVLFLIKRVIGGVSAVKVDFSVEGAVSAFDQAWPVSKKSWA